MYFLVFIIQKRLIQQRYHRKTFFQINILTSTPRVRVFERKSQSIVNSSHIYFGRIHIIPVTLLTKEFVHKVFNLFIEIIYFTVSDWLQIPWLILHNQPALTKFGRLLGISIKKSSIINNYPLKGRWIVVDIPRGEASSYIYLALFTDHEGDSCFRIYQTQLDINEKTNFL